MLKLTGKTLGVTRELRGNPGQQFEQVEIHVLDGVDVTRCRAGRDFPTSSLPEEGEHVVLDVALSAYAGKNGARAQVTAIRRDFALEAELFGQTSALSAVND